MDAATALEWGLVTEVADEPVGRAREVARAWADGQPVALGETRRLLRAGWEMTREDAGAVESRTIARLVEDLAVGFRPTRARTLALAEAFARAERLLCSELAARQASLSFGQDYLVRADPDKLLQVLLNLVENALKAAAATIVPVVEHHIEMLKAM